MTPRQTKEVEQKNKVDKTVLPKLNLRDIIDILLVVDDEVGRDLVAKSIVQHTPPLVRTTFTNPNDGFSF